MPNFKQVNKPTVEITDIDGLPDVEVTMEVRLSVEDLSECIARYDEDKGTITLGYLLPDSEAGDPLTNSSAMGKLLFWDGSRDRDQDRHKYAVGRPILDELGLEDNDGYVDREIDHVPKIDKKVMIEGQLTTLFDKAVGELVETLDAVPNKLLAFLCTLYSGPELSRNLEVQNTWLRQNVDVVKRDAGDVDGHFFEEVTRSARSMYNLHWRSFLSPGVVIIEPNVGRDELSINVTDAWDGDFSDDDAIPSLWVADNEVMENLTYEGKKYDHAEAVKYAQTVCEEVVKVHNGDVWGVIVVEGQWKAFTNYIAYDERRNRDGEVWGFVGHDYAVEELRSQCGFAKEEKING